MKNNLSKRINNCKLYLDILKKINYYLEIPICHRWYYRWSLNDCSVHTINRLISDLNKNPISNDEFLILIKSLVIYSKELSSKKLNLSIKLGKSLVEDPDRLYRFTYYDKSKYKVIIKKLVKLSSEETIHVLLSKIIVYQVTSFNNHLNSNIKTPTTRELMFLKELLHDDELVNLFMYLPNRTFVSYRNTNSKLKNLESLI